MPSPDATSPERPPAPPAAAETRVAPNPAERPAGVVAVEFEPVDIETAMSTRGFAAFRRNYHETLDIHDTAAVNRAFQEFERGKSVARSFEFAMNNRLRADKKERMRLEERDSYRAYTMRLAAKDPSELAKLEQELRKREQNATVITQRKTELEGLKQRFTEQKLHEAREGIVDLETQKAILLEAKRQAEGKTFTNLDKFADMFFGAGKQATHEAQMRTWNRELEATEAAIAAANEVVSSPQQLAQIEAQIKKAEEEIVAAQESVFANTDGTKELYLRLIEESREKLDQALESDDVTVLQGAAEDFIRDRNTKDDIDYLNLAKDSDYAKTYPEKIKKRLDGVIFRGIDTALKELPPDTTPIRLERALRKYIKLVEDGMGVAATAEERKEYGRKTIVATLKKFERLAYADATDKETGRSVLLKDLIARLSAEPEEPPRRGTPSTAPSGGAGSGPERLPKAAHPATAGHAVWGAVPPVIAGELERRAALASSGASPKKKDVRLGDFFGFGGKKAEASAHEAPQETGPEKKASFERTDTPRVGDMVMWVNRYGENEWSSGPKRIKSIVGKGRRQFAHFELSDDWTEDTGVLLDLLHKIESKEKAEVPEPGTLDDFKKMQDSLDAAPKEKLGITSLTVKVKGKDTTFAVGEYYASDASSEPKQLSEFWVIDGKTYGIFDSAAAKHVAVLELLQKRDAPAKSSGTETGPKSTEIIDLRFQRVLLLGSDELRKVLDSVTMEKVVAAATGIHHASVERIFSHLSEENQRRYTNLRNLKLHYTDPTILSGQKAIADAAAEVLGKKVDGDVEPPRTKEQVEAELIRDTYFSYSDAPLSLEAKQAALESLKTYPNADKYAESLRHIFERHTKTDLEQMATEMLAKANETLSRLGIPVSPYGLSRSWAYWDIAKQEHFVSHPNETDSSKYSIESPFASEKKREAIVNRHIGWEVYRFYRHVRNLQETRPGDDPEFVQAATTVNELWRTKMAREHREDIMTLLDQKPKENGTLSSFNLARLGELLREAPPAESGEKETTHPKPQASVLSAKQEAEVDNFMKRVYRRPPPKQSEENT